MAGRGIIRGEVSRETVADFGDDHWVDAGGWLVFDRGLAAGVSVGFLVVSELGTCAAGQLWQSYRSLIWIKFDDLAAAFHLLVARLRRSGRCWSKRCLLALFALWAGDPMTWLWVFLIFCAAVVLWPLLALIERFEPKR